MPIYEYRCEKCGVFERTQRITDDPLQRCPTCRRKVRRLISNTSFQLKGSGWYVTDYARSAKNGKSEGTADAKPDSAGATGDSAAKPESTKPAKADKPAKTAAAAGAKTGS